MFSFFHFFTVENNPSVSAIENNSPKEKEMPKMIPRCVMEVVKSKLFAVVFLFFLKASVQFPTYMRIIS